MGSQSRSRSAWKSISTCTEARRIFLACNAASLCSRAASLSFSGTNPPPAPYKLAGEVSMKRLVPLLLLIVPAILHAEDQRPQAVVQKKFVSGGTIRLHLEAGGY